MNALRKALIAALLTTTLTPPTLITPVMAQSSKTQTCQTFIDNGMPFGYVGTTGVNLGATFSTVDSIEGTVSGTRTSGPDTVNLPASPHASMWQNQGYFVPAWGPTGGWKSFARYLGGTLPTNLSQAAPLMQDVIDVRFGSNDGIYPGKASVPQGTDALYVVQRNRTGHSPLRLTPQHFSLKICGQPAVQQLCQTVALDEANPWQSSAQITLPGAPKKLVSATGSYTVAALGTTPAETKSIVQPIGNQPRSAKFAVSMGNKEVFVFMKPNPSPLPVVPQPGAPDYVTKAQPVENGRYVIMGTSAGTPAHGNITGTVKLCVQ